jgi:hypothetical protein
MLLDHMACCACAVIKRDLTMVSSSAMNWSIVKFTASFPFPYSLKRGPAASRMMSMLPRLLHDAVDVLIDSCVIEGINYGSVGTATALIYCGQPRKPLRLLPRTLWQPRGQLSRPRQIRPHACPGGLKRYSFDAPSFLICTFNLKTF